MERELPYVEHRSFTYFFIQRARDRSKYRESPRNEHALGMLIKSVFISMPLIFKV